MTFRINYNSIGGGRQNTASSYYSTVSGGYGNVALAYGGTVAGGGCNNVGSDSCFGVISGGRGNKICAGTCYSSILGGQNNTVVHNWASASGYNITSIMDCTFHANQIIVQNICVSTSPFCAPPGTLVGCTGALYYVNTGTACQLFVV